MDALLAARDLSYRYPGTDRDVISQVTISADRGEAIALLGPNGTGKSTLLKCMAGLLSPSYGSVHLDGMDITGMARSAVAKRIGFVPQSQSSPFPYLVHEVVLMGRASHLGLFQNPGTDDMQRSDEALRMVGIPHLASRPCTNLSGGEWQLVLIARAIAQQPDILLLDEPTSHLDIGNQMKVLRVIDRLKREGLCIIVATHFPDHAFMTADRVVILKDQMVITDGSPDQEITNSLMEEVYGVPVAVVHIDDPVCRKVCVPVWYEP